jgi:uncharacterized protein (DUF302 family)
MARLQEMVSARGLTTFALIRFSADALRSGLQMRFTELLVFGNPVAGTPVIVSSPSAAIDLPLKVLVEADADGVVWLSCNDPVYLQRRHDVSPDLISNISGVEPLMRAVALEGTPA